MKPSLRSKVCWVIEFSSLRPDLQASIGAKVQEHVKTAVKGIWLERVDNHQKNIKGRTRDKSLQQVHLLLLILFLSNLWLL